MTGTLRTAPTIGVDRAPHAGVNSPRYENSEPLRVAQIHSKLVDKDGMNLLLLGKQILPARLPALPPLPLRLPVVPKTIIDPQISHRPVVPVSCPLTERLPEIRATNRVKRQRRKHVKKKHKKQRLREMRYVIMKKENEKEAVAEAAFRKDMSVSLKKALEFDADKYVRDTIARAKWVPTPDNTESLKIGIRWSDFMTVEQLFGVPDGDYIDKKHGFAGEEDWQKILELREKYDKEYRRKK